MSTGIIPSTAAAGSATSANQALEIAALIAIDAGIPSALGQTTMAASMPVTIASNQSAVPISGTVTVDTSLLATQATLAALLAKVIAAPSTEAKQDTGNTSLATIAAKDFATQTTLAAVLAKIIAAPATEAKQDTQITAEQAIQAAVQIMDDWDETDRAKVNIIAGQAGVAASDGNVDALTQRVVVAANVLSTNNSSTTNLEEFGRFTGTSEEIMSYNEVRITCYSDVASANDGLSIQQSTDNVTWAITDTYTVAAATGKTFSVPRQARYFRIVYTNGVIAQTTFILQTSFTRIAGKSSSQRPSDNYTNETDLEQQQAFLMNYNNATNTWYRTRGDSANGLLVNPNGFNTDTQRRLEEQMVLRIAEDSNRNLYNTERYSGRGYELR